MGVRGVVDGSFDSEIVNFPGAVSGADWSTADWMRMAYGPVTGRTPVQSLDVCVCVNQSERAAWPCSMSYMEISYLLNKTGEAEEEAQTLSI